MKNKIFKQKVIPLALAAAMAFSSAGIQFASAAETGSTQTAAEEEPTEKSDNASGNGSTISDSENGAASVVNASTADTGGVEERGIVEENDAEPAAAAEDTEDRLPTFDHAYDFDGSYDGHDFTSCRLLAAAEDPSVFTWDTQVLSEYNGIYLLQFENENTAKNAYSYYYSRCVFVEPDMEVTAAAGTDEQDNVADGNSNETADISDINTGDDAISALNSLTEEAVEYDTKTPVIALIDTGVSDNNAVIERASVIGDDPSDENGHGDKMLGAILGQDPDAQIVSIKALDKDGKGSVSDLYAAIEYAAAENVNIINLSLSAYITEGSETVAQAVEDAEKAGITVVGAAGNNGKDVKYFIPGSIEYVLVAGSCDEDGTIADFSNYGDTVDYNVVSDSTSEAAAKLTGYIAKNGISKIADVLNNGLIYECGYAKEDAAKDEDGDKEDEESNKGSKEDGSDDALNDGYVHASAATLYTSNGTYKIKEDRNDPKIGYLKWGDEAAYFNNRNPNATQWKSTSKIFVNPKWLDGQYVYCLNKTYAFNNKSVINSLSVYQGSAKTGNWTNNQYGAALTYIMYYGTRTWWNGTDANGGKGTWGGRGNWPGSNSGFSLGTGGTNKGYPKGSLYYNNSTYKNYYSYYTDYYITQMAIWGINYEAGLNHGINVNNITTNSSYNFSSNVLARVKSFVSSAKTHSAVNPNVYCNPDDFQLPQPSNTTLSVSGTNYASQTVTVIENINSTGGAYNYNEGYVKNSQSPTYTVSAKASGGNDVSSMFKWVQTNSYNGSDGGPIKQYQLRVSKSDYETWSQTHPGETITITVTGKKTFNGLHYALVYVNSTKSHQDLITIHAQTNTTSLNKQHAINFTLAAENVTSLSIDKVDNNGKALSGASMQLLSSDGKTVIDSWTSGTSKHTVDSTKISAGTTYIVRETKAPSGYVINSDKKITLVNGSNTVTFKDPRCIVYKTDEDDNYLSGAQLQVINSSGKVVDSWTSDGKAHYVSGLTVGQSYTLHEIAAPKGYIVADDVKFTVYEDGSKNIISMEDPKTSLSIIKADIDGDPLEGAKMQLIDSNGNIIDEWTTDDEYPHIVDNTIISTGTTYTVRETKAPTGYAKAQDKQITLQAGTNTVTFVDPQIVIDKYAAVNTGNENLEGAVLQILDTNNKVVEEWTSSKTAHTVQASLEVGKTYTLHEKTPPSGYATAADRTFTVSGTANTVVSMEDESIKIKFKKQDKNGKLVPGASMVLLDENENELIKWTTTTDPYNIDPSLLAAGKTYTIRELQAPAGYNKAADKVFTVQDTTDEQDLEMVDLATDITIKKVDQDGNFVKGASLEIHDKDGKTVLSWTSGDSDENFVAKLNPGEKYTLVETKAPAGYAAADDVEFTVTPGGSEQIITMTDEKLEKLPDTGGNGTSRMMHFAVTTMMTAIVMLALYRKMKKE